MPYPTGSDLITYLGNVPGATIPGLTEADEVMNSVWEDWELDSGWVPFLGSSGTLTIDSPGKRIWYPSKGILSLSSLTVGTTALVQNTDYWLDNPLDNGPFTSISLRASWSVDHHNWVAVGVFGFTNTLPVGVKRALLAKGADRLLHDHDEDRGPITREKVGPVEFQYAGGQAVTKDAIDYGGQVGVYNEALGRYCRKAIYGADAKVETWVFPYSWGAGGVTVWG